MFIQTPAFRNEIQPAQTGSVGSDPDRLPFDSPINSVGTFKADNPLVERESRTSWYSADSRSFTDRTYPRTARDVSPTHWLEVKLQRIASRRGRKTWRQGQALKAYLRDFERELRLRNGRPEALRLANLRILKSDILQLLVKQPSPVRTLCERIKQKTDQQLPDNRFNRTARFIRQLLGKPENPKQRSYIQLRRDIFTLLQLVCQTDLTSASVAKAPETSPPMGETGVR